MKPKVSILDHGLNLELAFSLGRESFDAGYYFQWKKAYPTASQNHIGSGFDQFKWIEHQNEAYEFADTIICPDTHSRDWVLTAHLLKEKKYIFGAGNAEMLEENRTFFKTWLESKGLPVNGWRSVTGVDDLEKILRSEKNLYIKLDGKYRGDFETFKHVDWSTTRDEHWGHLLGKLGAMSDECPFVIEEPIESDVEIGYDGIAVAGQLCPGGSLGYESKDAAHIACVTDNIPAKMKAINDAVLDEFKDIGVSTFYSNEVRVGKNGKFYFTDPTIRCGHPVFAVQSALYSNIGQVVYDAAHGKVTPLKAREKYGAGLLVKSTVLSDGWIKEVKFPKEMAPYVKLQNALRNKGKISIMPESFIACTAVGLGETAEEASENAKEVAKAIDVPGKFCDYDALDTILEKSIPEGKKYGIEF